MSKTSTRVNPWVPAVVLGVVAILFALYAAQTQSEAAAKIKELESKANQCELQARRIKEEYEQKIEAAHEAVAAARRASDLQQDSKKPVDKKK
jgi:vacuolar-type H+-ATPase subunit I/STV1